MPQSHDGLRILYKNDLASLLKLGERQIDRLRKIGRLPPPIQIGKRVAWTEESLKAFLEGKDGK